MDEKIAFARVSSIQVHWHDQRRVGAKVKVQIFLKSSVVVYIIQLDKGAQLLK